MRLTRLVFRLSCYALLARCALLVVLHDCGNKELTQMDVYSCDKDATPCAKTGVCELEPCLVRKGRNMTVDVNFALNQDTYSVNTEISVKIDNTVFQVINVYDLPSPWNYTRVNGDNGEDILKHTFTVFIPSLLPKSSANFTFRMSGDHALMLCGTFNATILE